MPGAQQNQTMATTLAGVLEIILTHDLSKEDLVKELTMSMTKTLSALTKMNPPMAKETLRILVEETPYAYTLAHELLMSLKEKVEGDDV